MSDFKVSYLRIRRRVEELLRGLKAPPVDVFAIARGLGAEVAFCSVVGEDEGASLARANLEVQGIGIEFFTDTTRPTTRKQRYRAHNKTLLRAHLDNGTTIARDHAEIS